MLKKILLFLIINYYFFNNLIYASELKNIQSSFKETTEDNYNHKTVFKHYKFYYLKIKNKNSKPLLLSSNSELFFITEDGDAILSENRRTQYRKVRKRDMGRYYWFALPGAIIAGGITGITFFIGAPVAAAVYVGMYLPTDKAVRENVKISQDLFNSNFLPIRMLPNKEYCVRILVPKELEIDKIRLTNLSFDLKNMYDLEVEKGE